MAEVFTGGCQCGAVRFRVEGPVKHASICNCRMCQKALGNFIAPFASFAKPIEWTRGRPSEFQSSQVVHRGFCSNCGTPLSYRWGDHQPSLTIGAFDNPNAILPTIEFARDNRHPVFAHYDALVPEEQGATDEERDILAILKSFQHPDRDTETWQPEEASHG
jgi:hypothetical protein